MSQQKRRRRQPRPRIERLASPISGWLHSAPDFIIIGAARSGTTSVLNLLRATPGVLDTPTEELHFFDSARYRAGMSWYRRQFPWAWEKPAARLRGRGPGITGENSPFYLAHPETPARIRAALPDVRLIALLRDPTDRAISHWNWRVNRGSEARTFEDAARAELALLREGLALSESDTAVEDRETYRTERFEMYLARGLYLEQLKRWHAAFGRDQLLVLVSEHFYADPLAGMRRVWRHLGLKPLTQLPPASKNARKRKLAVDPDVVAEVRGFYRPQNQVLAAYLETDLPWDQAPVPVAVAAGSASSGGDD